MKASLRWAARIFALLLCLSLLFSVYIPTAKAENQPRYGYTKLENNQQRTIYTNLVEAIAACKTSTSFTLNVSASTFGADLQKAVDMIRADYPEFFWFQNLYGISVTGSTLTIQSIDNKIGGRSVSGTDAAFISAKTALDREVNSALAGMPKGSDYDKALYLHDYVTKKVEYVMAGDHQTAYGALVGGKAVCAGYARAYQLLLNAAGIESWYVTGQSVNPSTGRMEGHGWNVVFLDGKSYYTDVTWDDQTSHLFHAYFMLSRDEMGQTHFPKDPSLLPDGNHTGKDYFTVKSGNGSGVGVFTSSTTVEQVKNWMKRETSDRWICEINDSSHLFSQWIKNHIDEVKTALGLNRRINYTCHTLGDEILFHIDCQGHSMPLKKVKEVPATCKDGGTSAYYVCETCNAWFWDAEAKQLITDHNSVKTPVADHQYTVWKNNDSQHWKECKVCSAEMPNSRAAHKDTNADRKCDDCNSAVEGQTNNPTTNATTSTTASTQATTAPTTSTTAPTQATTPTTSATKPSTVPETVPNTEGSTVPTTTPATVPSTSVDPTQQTVQPSTAPSGSNSTQSSVSQSTQGSTSTDEKLPSGSASTTETSAVSSSGNPSQPEDQDDGGNVVLIVVFALAGCGVTAGAAIVFIRFRKK